MKILILHRIPYHKINYALGIDHGLHQVIYVGIKSALSNIPENLRCLKVERPGLLSAAEETLELAANGLFADGKPDHVLSLSEYELLDAARVREAFGIAGPSIHNVQLVRDKILMKAAVQAAGIRVPLHLECHKLRETDESPWQGPSVLKPRDGASSENIKIFSSFQAACKAICSGQTSIESFVAEKYELEEFVEGPIIHVDGLVVRGELECWLPSRYVGTCLQYALGEPLGSAQFAQSSKLKEWTQKALQAVNIRDGSFHLEAIESANGLVFLEIANRVGGADVVDTFEMATGVFLPAAELAARVGDHHLYDSKKSFRKPAKYFGWFVYPGHHLPPGFPEFNDLRRFETDKHVVRMQKLENRPLPRQITYQSVDVPLAGVAVASSEGELADWMRGLFSAVTIRSSADNVGSVKDLLCPA